MTDISLFRTIQLFWPLLIEPLDEDKWFDDDYDGPRYDTPEQQIPLLPDLFSAFSTSWQSMNSPHSDELPKGVYVHGIFFTFDKKLGVCVCANYKISPSILRSTKAFKDTVNWLVDDIGFDSWLDTHFTFKHDRKRFSLSSSASVERIVAPVECYDRFFFKWDSIEDIDNVELALSRENDAYNIIRRPEEHKKELELVNNRIEDLTKIIEARGCDPNDSESIRRDKRTLKSYEFVNDHKTQYFFGTMS